MIGAAVPCTRSTSTRRSSRTSCARGRKTATIRLGDKSRKYQKGMIVRVLVGARYGPREHVFDAVIDKVEVKRLGELSPREIEHDNPEIRRPEEMAHFLGQLYNREVTEDDTVTVIRFSDDQRLESERRARADAFRGSRLTLELGVGCSARRSRGARRGQLRRRSSSRRALRASHATGDGPATPPGRRGANGRRSRCVCVPRSRHGALCRRRRTSGAGDTRPQ